MAAKKPDPLESRRRIARADIKRNMELYGVKDSRLAIECQFTLPTMGKKWERPETFKLGELWRAADFLKLSPLQAASIILGREVTIAEIRKLEGF